MAWPQTVRKTDLRIDTYRGSGPGGQNRNKRDTAVRMTHLETGISASSETGRTQEENRRLAFRRLAAKLAPLMTAAARAGVPTPAEKARIRTYHAIDQRVTDVRLPGRRFGYGKVVDGAGLDELLAELRKKERAG